MLIVRTADGLVIFDNAISLDNQGCEGVGWKCDSVTSDEHFTVQHLPIQDFKPNKWVWNGTTCVQNPSYETPPPTPVQIPQEVTMRQARLALLENGLLVNVQPAINSLPEPDKTKAQIEWEYSNALQRGNPFVDVLGAALGLSSQDLDDLFIQASAL